MRLDKKHKAVKYKAINVISPQANAVLSIIMVILCAIFIVPLLLTISISLTSPHSLAFNGYQFIPEEWSTLAYKSLFLGNKRLWTGYRNTIFYTVTNTVLALFLMSMFAYVLSRKEFKARNTMAFYAFFTTLFSGGLVPQYILYNRYLHITNTVWVFLLPGLISAFDVIILRTFINTTIPDALFESAKLDGANEWQVYWKIVMPLFKAGLATIGLFRFVGMWNDWFTGLTYIRKDELQPLMTILQKIQKSIDMLKSGGPASATPEAMELLRAMPGESTRMAMTIISVLPLLVCYPFFQKYFIHGLTVGSVKG